MAKNDFQYGGWNYYTLQCGTILVESSGASHIPAVRSGLPLSSWNSAGVPC